MPARSHSSKPASRRADPPAQTATASDKDKLRERLLAMILRNEALRKQTPK